MSSENYSGKIEAILFASGEPVSMDRIAEVLGITPESCRGEIEILSEKYNTPASGIQLLMLGDEVQFCTNPAYIEPVREILDIKKNAPLSPAAMEVLSLVAYNEPVTKAYIEQVRGVDCSGVIGSLTQKGLIEERGRLELPGRPLLYGTTSTFLRCFGISSLDELPELPQEKTEEETTENE